MIEQKYIQEIKSICSNFLIEHGGELSGYLTLISGTTENNADSYFDINVPNRTREENDELALKLKSELITFLNENNLNVIIKFIPRHIEHYCFNTYIEFVYPAGRLF